MTRSLICDGSRTSATCCHSNRAQASINLEDTRGSFFLIVDAVFSPRSSSSIRDLPIHITSNMSRMLDYLKGLSGSEEYKPCKCAFIPRPILENVEQAEDTPEEVRLSLRATIEASKETLKEREEVADHEKNPHEPKLPELQKSEDEPQGPCATVDIHDGLNSDYTELPGPLRRKYGQAPVSDAAVNSCYDVMNKTQTFFRNVYGWDSIDDKNVAMIATVHFGANVANAFFEPEKNQMVYGSGNKLMYNFPRSYDVVGHELTHGIIQHSSGMIYQNQPGALNEHCADVFGTLLEQYAHNQTADEADWILGQDVLFPNEPKIAMRSMKAPGTAYDDPRMGKDDQPAHMKDYPTTKRDSGGVHTNSGIPNRAFYLAAHREGRIRVGDGGEGMVCCHDYRTAAPDFCLFCPEHD